MTLEAVSALLFTRKHKIFYLSEQAKKLFWYAYGWPCGQKPEYGDQIYQEKSWGKFIPFGFIEIFDGKEIKVLSTTDGVLTPAGILSQSERKVVTGVD
jgi:hypothetical protein